MTCVAGAASRLGAVPSERRFNACIQIISSRTQCIEDCLQNLHDRFNKHHDYPVYVYYFDDVYDDIAMRRRVRAEISRHIQFVRVPYETPAWVPEHELFHNRQDLWYVRSSFPPSRKGYLHMCHFNINAFGYPHSGLHLYDWVLNLDDEGGFNVDFERQPFAELVARDVPLAAFCVVRREPHQGTLDCRTGLFEFTRDYIRQAGITPRSSQLCSALAGAEPARDFHRISWMDSYVVRTAMFRSASWQRWIAAVNRSGGVYRYRWGDNEIFSLYAHLHIGEPCNLGVVDGGMYQQDMFKARQAIAPGVRDGGR